MKSRIKKVMNYKKPAFWICVFAVIVCIVTAFCFLTDPKSVSESEINSPFGQTYTGTDTICVYHVSEIVYDAPQYSFTYTPETAPLYRLTQSNELEILEDRDTEDWLTPGQMTPFSLTKENFIDLCVPNDDSSVLRALLNDNVNSWHLDVLSSDNGTFYYLLQQNDGSLYYCLGYHRSTKDVIRWIFKLEQATPVTAEPVTETPVTTEDTDPLETAIHNAIMEHNRHRSSNNSGDVFSCESHIIFDEKNLVACGPDASYEETTLYLMVLFQEYDLSDGTIKDMGGSHMPVVITFAHEDDNYTLLEYWTPEDGTYYLPSIQDKFPEQCWELAANTQLHILGQIQHCYDQAIQYGNLDTEQILDNLYRQIEQTSAKYSAPSDYIEAHPVEFREITYYGMHALKHAFGEFLKGGQTGLHGHVMALACQEILTNLGEPFKPDTYTTGQEWFEQFEAYAYSVAPQIVSPYSSQYRPSVRLLLELT